MDDAQYSEIIKDEANPRPDNCDGLLVVKTNQLIWELISPFAQTCDKKMQAIEKSVVKAAVLLCKTVNNLAKIEKEKNTDEFDNVIDECNDVLALLGHTNRQINLARRDCIRSELNSEYTHLCAHTQPYTTFLFGDDVSKTAKDIEDCSKIANHIYYGRGSSRGRGRFNRGRGRFGRSRGTRGRGIGRGTHNNYEVASTSYESGAKKLPQERGVKRIQKDVISQNKDEVSSLKKCKFEAGRLKIFIHVWKELTSDEQILDIVENCHIELENNDFMFEKSCSYQCNFNAKETSIMQKEIQKLLDIRVLIEVKNDEEQFLSPIFLWPKPNGEYRMILNLKKIQQICSIPSF
jgi:hypothetical protein